MISNNQITFYEISLESTSCPFFLWGSDRTIFIVHNYQYKMLEEFRTIANEVCDTARALRRRIFDASGQSIPSASPGRMPERSGRVSALLLFPLSFIYAFFKQTGRMTVWAERKRQ